LGGRGAVKQRLTSC